jgi:hypothetical protein
MPGDGFYLNTGQTGIDEIEFAARVILGADAGQQSDFVAFEPFRVAAAGVVEREPGIGGSQVVLPSQQFPSRGMSAPAVRLASSPPGTRTSTC